MNAGPPPFGRFAPAERTSLTSSWVKRLRDSTNGSRYARPPTPMRRLLLSLRLESSGPTISNPERYRRRKLFTRGGQSRNPASSGVHVQEVGVRAIQGREAWRL